MECQQENAMKAELKSDKACTVQEAETAQCNRTKRRTVRNRWMVRVATGNSEATNTRKVHPRRQKQDGKQATNTFSPSSNLLTHVAIGSSNGAIAAATFFCHRKALALCETKGRMGEIAAADRTRKGKRCTVRWKMIRLHSAAAATRFHCATKSILPCPVHPDFPRCDKKTAARTVRFTPRMIHAPCSRERQRKAHSAAQCDRKHKPLGGRVPTHGAPKSRTPKVCRHPVALSSLAFGSGRGFVALSSAKNCAADCTVHSRTLLGRRRENATNGGRKSAQMPAGKQFGRESAERRENGWKMFFCGFHWRQILMQL